MKTVYLLEHIYEVGENEEFREGKLIGIYSSREKAENVVEEYKILPGFEDYPVECFHIDEYKLDENHWEEGFVDYSEK